MKPTFTTIEDVFQLSPVAMALVSTDFKVVSWNGKFGMEFRGVEEGSPLVGLFGDGHGLRLYEWRESLADAPSSEGQFRFRRVGQVSSIVLLTMTPLRHDGSAGMFLATVWPVEQQGEEEPNGRQNDELENLVEARTEALRRANKELEMFSYSVSHDLRSPLRAVLGYSAALMEDYADRLGSEGEDYLKRITASAQRMDSLITAILSVSRISRAAVERADVSLTDLATGLVPEVIRHCPNAQIVVQPAMVAHADPALLRVVVANLLDNACKFSSQSKEPKVEIGIASDMPESPFFVRDTGVGFDPQYSEKIFEPFERLHNETSFAGTGIGLFNVRRVIERHEGKVWAVSEPGKGATFYFTLN